VHREIWWGKLKVRGQAGDSGVVSETEIKARQCDVCSTDNIIYKFSLEEIRLIKDKD
jgi:hypothetical protein